MSSGAARWALAHLDGWTWLVAEYRVWLITLATVTGLAVPLLVAAGKHLPRPAPSRLIRSGAMALAFSAAMVTICSPPESAQQVLDLGLTCGFCSVDRKIYSG